MGLVSTNGQSLQFLIVTVKINGLDSTTMVSVGFTFSRLVFGMFMTNLKLVFASYAGLFPFHCTCYKSKKKIMNSL